LLAIRSSIRLFPFLFSINKRLRQMGENKNHSQSNASLRVSPSTVQPLKKANTQGKALRTADQAKAFYSSGWAFHSQAARQASGQ
jgi:hypothetical protein